MANSADWFLEAIDGTKLQVDADFHPLLSRHSWFPVPIDGSPSVFATKIGNALIYLAHLVFGQVARGPQRKVVLSFLDKDPRNCRLANLSPMDIGLSRHRAVSSKRGGLGSSAYRGVVRIARTGRFIAKIGIEGKQVYLGSFKLEEDAAHAYDAAALAQHGERAVLNFPLGFVANK